MTRKEQKVILFLRIAHAVVLHIFHSFHLTDAERSLWNLQKDE